jgi:hypothetical protein
MVVVVDVDVDVNVDVELGTADMACSFAGGGVGRHESGT